MFRPSYEELLARIEQLEKENYELRIRCGMGQTTPRPVSLALSPEEKVELFRGFLAQAQESVGRA
jgi:hypothetical protein